MVETGKKPQSREKGAPRSVPWVREGGLLQALVLVLFAFSLFIFAGV